MLAAKVDLAKLENLRVQVCESKGKEDTFMGQIINNSFSMAMVTYSQKCVIQTAHNMEGQKGRLLM